LRRSRGSSSPKETLPQIADGPLGLAPVDALPIGPSLRSVCFVHHVHLTCPLVCSLCHGLSVIHQAHVSPLSGWISPLARSCPAGYDFPPAFRRLAFASWAFLSRCGIGPSLQVADCDERTCWPLMWQTAAGFPRSTWVRCDGSGCPLYPGALVSLRNECTPVAARRGHSRTTPLAHYAVLVSHRPACWNDETSSRIRSRSPGPSSPGLRRVDGSSASWAFPPASHPAVTSDARGGGDRSGTLT
jgi:hypothetical protein